MNFDMYILWGRRDIDFEGGGGGKLAALRNWRNPH
jgi:hypothetical protein